MSDSVPRRRGQSCSVSKAEVGECFAVLLCCQGSGVDVAMLLVGGGGGGCCCHGGKGPDGGGGGWLPGGGGGGGIIPTGDDSRAKVGKREILSKKRAFAYIRYIYM